MSDFSFTIKGKSRVSNARRATIITPHGAVETPAFVTVGTKGTVKSLDPEDLSVIGTQFVFVNTYHMVLSPTPDVVATAGGIHTFSKITKPIITDSGGFQVFSLARRSPKGEGGSARDRSDIPHLVRITDDGVEFRSHTDGAKHFFSPEFSVSAQKKIGADCVVAFDECLPVGATEKQTERSIKRTHEWAKRSLDEFAGPVSPFPAQVLAKTARLRGRPHGWTPAQQKIYGVIQGGMFKKLRQESAEFIASLPFWGLSIGGVSVGETKRQMREQVGWVMDVIHTDMRPRHLLGIGHLDDILDMVRMGIDTFDCVLPTRLARIGRLYINETETIDITESKYKSDQNPIDTTCECHTCQIFSRAYLHHLFKERELLGYRLATIHNLFFMELFFSHVRNNILAGNL